MGPTSVAPDELTHLTQKIYCIIAYCSHDHSSRCFGYFFSEHTAKSNLFKKWSSLVECLYDYFLIEEVDEGLHPISKITSCYNVTEQNTLVESDIPASRKRIINWSIG